MPNIDAHTRRLLAQNAELTGQRIASSRRSRIDAITDICAKVDIVWAVWPDGQRVVKGEQLVAEGARGTNWIAIPCADAAEANDFERHLS